MPRVSRPEPDYQEVTLQHVREIRRYNDWVFSHLRPHLRGSVLEIGCGIGTYSARLRPFVDRLTCIDMNAGFARKVAALFHGDEHVVVSAGTLGGGLAFAAASFDVIVCLNVLEHIENDGAALQQLRSWLVPGGELLLQVPAHPRLFGTIDRSLGHWRRYTPSNLAGLLERHGFELREPVRSLYLLAVPGWWWFGRVMRRRVVPETTVRAANALVVISRWLERLLPFEAGLTLVATARLPEVT